MQFVDQPDGRDPVRFPISIVDDDQDVRDGLGFMLEARGFEFRAFASGPEFLDRLDELGPSAVLLDIRMPGMDGLDVLRALRAAGLGWPVIMMTGHGEAGLAVSSISGGALDFLQKPFEEKLLLEALRAAGRVLSAIDPAARLD